MTRIAAIAADLWRMKLKRFPLTAATFQNARQPARLADLQIIGVMAFLSLALTWKAIAKSTALEISHEAIIHNLKPRQSCNGF